MPAALRSHHAHSLPRAGSRCARRWTRRSHLQRRRTVRSTGIIALTIEDGDDLVGVRLTDGTHDVLLATREGRAIRFNETKLRPMGRSAG